MSIIISRDQSDHSVGCVQLGTSTASPLPSPSFATPRPRLLVLYLLSRTTTPDELLAPPPRSMLRPAGRLLSSSSSSRLTGSHHAGAPPLRHAIARHMAASAGAESARRPGPAAQPGRPAQQPGSPHRPPPAAGDPHNAYVLPVLDIAGAGEGPLAGLTVAVKDLFDVSPPARARPQRCCCLQPRPGSWAGRVQREVAAPLDDAPGAQAQQAWRRSPAAAPRPPSSSPPCSLHPPCAADPGTEDRLWQPRLAAHAPASVGDVACGAGAPPGRRRGRRRHAQRPPAASWGTNGASARGPAAH
jgi:hypothetical protein